MEQKVEVDGETRKNEKTKKAMILLRQRRSVEYGTYEVPTQLKKIRAPDKDPMPAWSVIEWDGSSGFQLSSLDQNLDGGAGMVNMSPYRHGWSRFQASTTTVCGSSIFFTAGLLPGLRMDYINYVSSFDIEKGWKKRPNMKQPRCFHAACTVGDTIYVLGTALYPPKLLSMDTWGERFDILSSEWFNLPKPPESLYKLHHIRAYAVYYNTQAFSYSTIHKDVRGQVKQNHNLILFPLPNFSPYDSRICVFDCDTNTWLRDICPNVPPLDPIYPYGPYTRPMRHDRLAVVDGILFWHHSGKIYGYDLINEEYLNSLFQLPPEKDDPCGMCHQSSSHQPDDDLMFFINPGDHKLLLLFQTTQDQYTIHCYLFQVQIKKPGQNDAYSPIVELSYSPFSTKSMKREALLDALLMCVEVPDLDGQPQPELVQRVEKDPVNIMAG